MDDETTPAHRDPGLLIIVIVGLAVAFANVVARPADPPEKVAEKSSELAKARDGVVLAAANRALSPGQMESNGQRARKSG
ncbi:hypothetical protein [Aureimonas mangrovi]|uniref:hypothetical protein n=1 Tax=Aureimonas mangrovi TaxID=2758041 RepID=UPI00163D5EFC|nr:hypothetical protein [Aureimonas mangrovi]